MHIFNFPVLQIQPFAQLKYANESSDFALSKETVASHCNSVGEMPRGDFHNTHYFISTKTASLNSWNMFNDKVDLLLITENGSFKLENK